MILPVRDVSKRRSFRLTPLTDFLDRMTGYAESKRSEERLFSRECAVSLDAKTATPLKSDGGGLRLVAYASESAPSLPWKHERRCRAAVR